MSGAPLGPRRIALRRPVTLSVVTDPFVPEPATGLLDDIDARWAAVCARYPEAFDGRIYHVIGVHRNGCGGAVLHVADCAYRFFAVQDAEFDLGVRPLGVKGIALRGGRALLGKRSDQVLGHGGHWEFAPGGAVEPGQTPAEAVARELEEETTFRLTAEPTCIGLLYDEDVRTWEVVFRLTVDEGNGLGSAEYAEVRWCQLDDLPRPLSPVAERIVPWATTMAGGSSF